MQVSLTMPSSALDNPQSEAADAPTPLDDSIDPDAVGPHPASASGADGARDEASDKEPVADEAPGADEPPVTDEQDAQPYCIDLRRAKPPPRPPSEALSPFIGYDADAAALPDELLNHEGRAPLVVELLRDPDAVVERILDPEEVAGTVVGASLLIPLCGAFFTIVAMAPWATTTDIALGAVLAPTNLLLAIAAALGPAWGVSVIMAVRVPVPRLVACMLASVAAASLVMLALSPLPYALWKVDDHWAGPLALFGVFCLAGVVAGRRLKALLLSCAEEVVRRAAGDDDATMGVDDAFRVGVLARMAMVSLAFAGCLAVWAFNPFS